MIVDGRLFVGGWNLPTEESGWNGSWLSTPIASGGWHHVSLVLAGSAELQNGVIKGYLDGQRFGDDQQGVGSQVWSHPNDTGVGIARGATRFHDGAATSGHAFSGRIDDVRIYNRALAEDEIEVLALAR